MDTNKYLFLSCSSRDKPLAREIVKELEEQLSIRVWMDDKDLLPGSDWEYETERAITRATAVLTLVSNNYVTSKWFTSHAKTAIEQGIPLIPVLLEGVIYGDIPDLIKPFTFAYYPRDKEKLFKAILIIFGQAQAPTGEQSVQRGDPSRPEAFVSESPVPNEPDLQVPAQENSSTIELPLSEDRTPFHKDSPANRDYLGRKGFVEALAQWTDRYWTEYQTADKSFIINIHGQWGAGKTTFLNLLQKELQKEDQSEAKNDWIVVWFNAWENRRIKPEWWPLLDRIYRESVLQKKAKQEQVWHIRLQEWWWRFFSGRKWELLGFVTSFTLLIFIYYWVMRTGFLPDKDFMTRVEGVAKAIGLVFSGLSTIYLGTRFVSQTLSNTGSAKGAEVYLQFTPDPIDGIKRHFDEFIEKKVKKPVVVFIDDLDRCDREYLVNLLESIQTLLNHRKVFYVIAADQRWLFAAYEETYKEFRESIKEPGRKIGYLFLEKIFQLSISIPKISDEARKVYLDYLLGKSEEIEEKREQLKREVANAGSEQALINKVQSQLSGTIEKVLMREVAVARSASLEIEKATVHFLSNFAHLMEPNPRAIKRLVTFYGVLRAVAILSDEQIISDLTKRNQLALWTIVRMRWPLLADYLEEYPQYLDTFKTGNPNQAIHTDLKDLVKDEEVMDVLCGKGINAELDTAALKRFTSLKATERTF